MAVVREGRSESSQVLFELRPFESNEDFPPDAGDRATRGGSLPESRTARTHCASERARNFLCVKRYARGFPPPPPRTGSD